MSDEQLTCDFCGKTQAEVTKLIAGPKTYICNECVTLSVSIISEGEEPVFPTVDAAEPVRRALEASVVGQSAAVTAVVGALRQHLVGGLSPALPTPIILLAGPPGCGKTTLARALVEAAPLPSFLGDLDRVTGTGFVGDDVEQLLNELVTATPHATLARRGVLAMDNLQRVVAKELPQANSRDVAGAEVQRALLRVLEGRDCISFDARMRHPQQQWATFATRGLMRVVLAQTPSDVTLTNVREQLLAQGVWPSLLSRVHVTVPMRRLTREDLHEVLTRPKRGLLPRALAFLESAGVTLSVGVPMIERIVDRAVTAGDGAWSLERQVSGVVHDVASRGASGRLLYTAEELDRVEA